MSLYNMFYANSTINISSKTTVRNTKNICTSILYCMLILTILLTCCVFMMHHLCESVYDYCHYWQLSCVLLSLFISVNIYVCIEKQTKLQESIENQIFIYMIVLVAPAVVIGIMALLIYKYQLHFFSTNDDIILLLLGLLSFILTMIIYLIYWKLDYSLPPIIYHIIEVMKIIFILYIVVFVCILFILIYLLLFDRSRIKFI